MSEAIRSEGVEERERVKRQGRRVNKAWASIIQEWMDGWMDGFGCQCDWAQGKCRISSLGGRGGGGG